MEKLVDPQENFSKIPCAVENSPRTPHVHQIARYTQINESQQMRKI